MITQGLTPGFLFPHNILVATPLLDFTLIGLIALLEFSISALSLTTIGIDPCRPKISTELSFLIPLFSTGKSYPKFFKSS